MLARAALEQEQAVQAALKKERVAVRAALEQERAEVQAFKQRLAVQAGGAVSPFVPSSFLLPALLLPPHYFLTFLIIRPPISGSLTYRYRLPSLSPSPHRSGPSGSGPRSSGRPDIIERGDDSLATPPPPSYPSYRHLITVPPYLTSLVVNSPRSHLPVCPSPQLVVTSPHCQPMSQAGPLGLINASMNGHLEEVHALVAAGACKEAEDEVGGWVGGWVGKGTYEEGAGCWACVHESDGDIDAFYVSHSVAGRPSSWPSKKATSRWCRLCWQRAPTRRPGGTWWVSGMGRDSTGVGLIGVSVS